MNDQEIGIAVAISVVLIAMGVFLKFRQGQKRTLATYEAHARQRGYLFENDPEWQITGLDLGDENRSAEYRVTQGISCADSDKTVRFLHFRKKSRSGSKTNYSWGNALVVEFNEEIDLPEFYCLRCPKIMGAIVGRVLGSFNGRFKDFNFPDDKTFSDETLLMGADENAVREYFNFERRKQILALLTDVAAVSNKMASVAYSDKTLVLKPGQLVSGKRFKEFIEVGEKAVEYFSN